MRAALESDRAMVSEKGKVQKKRKKISSGFAILGWVGQGSELKSREIAGRVMKKILRFIGPAKKQKCGNCNIFLEILQQFFVAFVFFVFWSVSGMGSVKTQTNLTERGD